MIVETLHAYAPPELLDRDPAAEAVIDAIKADQLSDGLLESRGSRLGGGSRHSLFPCYSREAQVTCISV